MKPLSNQISVMRYPSFRLFIAAQFVSELGSAAFRVAIISYALAEFGSGAVGLLLAAFSFPQLVALLVGGLAADRFGRKQLAVYSDLVSGTLFIALWIGTQGAPSLFLVLMLVAVSGLSIAIFTPAAAAIVPALVPRGDLAPANAVRVSSGQLAAVCGPTLGGLALTVLDVRLLFLANALSFIIAAAVFQRATVPNDVSSNDEDRSVLADAVHGWRLLTSSSWLLAGIALGSMANLVLLPAMMVAVPIWLIDASGEAALGLYLASIAAGLALGAGLIAPRLDRSQTGVPFAAVALAAASTVLAVFVVGPATSILCGALVGASLGVFEVTWSTRLQSSIPADSLGRIFAADAWLSFVGRTAGLAVAGWASGLPIARPVIAAPAVALTISAGIGTKLIKAPDPAQSPTGPA